MGADLLLVNASPRGEDSESLRIAARVIAAAERAAPRLRVDRLDVFTEPALRFGGPEAAAKMARIAGRPQDAAAATAWTGVREMAERVVSAAALVLAVPMWNGGIPWALKLLIDVVTQPGIAFRFDPATGYHGLLQGRRAVCVYTSSVYHPGAPPAFGADFHAAYLEHWLAFCGIATTARLRLQPSHPSADLSERRERVLVEADRVGAALGAAVARPPA